MDFLTRFKLLPVQQDLPLNFMFIQIPSLLIEDMDNNVSGADFELIEVKRYQTKKYALINVLGKPISKPFEDKSLYD